LGIAPVPGTSIRELDALSYGVDAILTPDTVPGWFFSVDEFAVGLPAIAVPPPPTVTSEGAAGALEASADIFTSPSPKVPGIPPPGSLPPGLIAFNFGVADGNGGLTPFAAPGLNLIDPNPPAPGRPDLGDNLDALDVERSRRTWRGYSRTPSGAGSAESDGLSCNNAPGD